MNTELRSAGTIDEVAPPEVASAAGPAAAPALPRPAPRPLSSRVIALFGLVLGVGVLVALTLNRKIFTDVFWQLTAGQWMLAHHAIVGLDPFSYTESHHRWIADEWGSEVALAALYKAFGAAAYNIMAIVTGSLSLICSVLYARTLGARGGRLAFIAILLDQRVLRARGIYRTIFFLPLWMAESRRS